MSFSNLILADMLRSRNAELSQRIVSLHWDRHPHLEPVWGQGGRQKCEEDAIYHLNYLAAAVQMESTEIFRAYMGWTKVLLARYDIAESVLKDFMHTTVDVLSEQFPPTEAAHVNECILQSIDRLKESKDEPDSFINAHLSLPDLADAYLKTLLSGDRTDAVRVAKEAINDGLSLSTFYLKVLQPVQYEVGRLWQLGRINVAQEHLCTAMTQFVMAQLYSQFFTVQERSRHMVATCVGEEGHEVGMRMVVDLCDLAGWRTYYFGANTPNSSVVESAQAFGAQVLCISATMGYHLPHVANLIAEVRKADADKHMRILVGGMAFNVDKQLWKRIGADAYAPDAEEAVRIVDKLIPEGDHGGS